MRGLTLPVSLQAKARTRSYLQQANGQAACLIQIGDVRLPLGYPGMRKAQSQEHVYHGPLGKTPLSGEGVAFLGAGGELIAASVWHQR